MDFQLLSIGVHALFYIATFMFVVFTASLAYHWFVYGSSKRVSMLSLCVFLLVSAPLFITMAISLSLMPL